MGVTLGFQSSIKFLNNINFSIRIFVIVQLLLDHYKIIFNSEVCIGYFTFIMFITSLNRLLPVGVVVYRSLFWYIVGVMVHRSLFWYIVGVVVYRSLFWYMVGVLVYRSLFWYMFVHFLPNTFWWYYFLRYVYVLHSSWIMSRRNKLILNLFILGKLI